MERSNIIIDRALALYETLGTCMVPKNPNELYQSTKPIVLLGMAQKEKEKTENIFDISLLINFLTKYLEITSIFTQ